MITTSKKNKFLIDEVNMRIQDWKCEENGDVEFELETLYELRDHLLESHTED